MDRNLAEKKGGSVPNLTTHCRLLHHRPLFLKSSLLCSGDKFWEPCPDLELCKKLAPPPIKELVIPLLLGIVDNTVNVKAKRVNKRARPNKLLFGKHGT